MYCTLCATLCVYTMVRPVWSLYSGYEAVDIAMHYECTTMQPHAHTHPLHLTTRHQCAMLDTLLSCVVVYYTALQLICTPCVVHDLYLCVVYGQALPQEQDRPSRLRMQALQQHLVQGERITEHNAAGQA